MIKPKLIYIVFLFLLGAPAYAQDSSAVVKSFQRLDLVASLNFQNFALPFRDMGSNFTHPGIYGGVETNLNKKSNLLLRGGFSAYLNKEMGNGFMLRSDFVYQPHLFAYIHPSAKIGLGWLRSYHPVQAYEFIDGNWEKTAGGKSQLIVPAGIEIGYWKNSGHSCIKPYLGYQVILNAFYDQVLPVSFYSIIETGIKINLK